MSQVETNEQLTLNDRVDSLVRLERHVRGLESAAVIDRDRAAYEREVAEGKHQEQTELLAKAKAREELLEKEYQEKNSDLTDREQVLVAQREEFEEYKRTTQHELSEQERKNKEDATYNEGNRASIARELKEMEADREEIAELNRLAIRKNARAEKRMEDANTLLKGAGSAIFARSEHANTLLGLSAEKEWVDTWETWKEEEQRKHLSNFFDEDPFQMDDEEEVMAAFSELLEKKALTNRQREEYENMFTKFFPGK